MLMADILLAVLVFAPLVITYLLKSNAALGFLALCVGVVLSDFMAGDAQSFLQHFNYWLDISRIGIILLVAPPLITLILARHNLGKFPRSLGQLVVALCLGGVLAIEAMPMLNTINYNYASTQTWSDLAKAQSYLVGIGSVGSLLLVWLGNLRPHRKHGR